MQVEQLDKLDQYTTPATEGGTAEDGELGELSKKFYQAAVQVCVTVCVCVYGKTSSVYLLWYIKFL